MIALHCFPAANTPLGFFSRFDSILPQNTRFAVYLKGGPGCGKSTLLRAIGRHYEQQGLACEYFHCSSDPDSLDGVAVPQKGIAAMDATDPHAQEPRYPAARGELLDLGAFWDGAALREDAALCDLFDAYRGEFQSAYAYLQSAAALHRAAQSTLAACCRGDATVPAKRLAMQLLGGLPVVEGPAPRRELFLSAITPRGWVHHCEALLQMSTTRVRLLGPEQATCALLRRFAAAAAERGQAVWQFCSPMDPQHTLEHVYLPGQGIFVTTGARGLPLAGDYHCTVDLNETLQEGLLNPKRERLQHLQGLTDELIGAAVGRMAAAKTLHDELEAHYHPHVDFAAVQRAGAALLDKLDNL